jgi:hypothetical protein
LVSGRLKKAIIAIAAAFVIIVAGFAAAWYVAPNVNYWFVSAETTGGQDNPLTMFCQNTGNLTATFDLELVFTNAHLLVKTSLPYEAVSPSDIKFSFTLNPGETQNRTMWFEIDQNGNVSDFNIALSCHPNSGSILFRSEAGGAVLASYQKDVADANFTIRPPAVPA